jgi:2-polyprenyl-3-methyl-5-hydroxy-6-metoxy-1,4-benzoquinol methylase
VSLSRATLRKKSLGLPGPGPVSCDELAPLVGKAFELPADDPFVLQRGTKGHAYLEGADDAWKEHPEYMDFLHKKSPVKALKEAERDLVLHSWWPHILGGTVLDVGCGIGRFIMPLLDRGYDVVGVDADLDSLRRCAWHASGRRGALELHWSSVFTLPPGPFDVVIASEVLCYVPDTVGALRAIRAVMAPDARLLLSMEARYGWALSQDAPANGLEAALDGDGVLDLPGDRWVRTMDEATLRAVLAEAGFEALEVRPSHWLPDGPLEGVMPETVSLEELLALEARCAAHPVFSPLHRLWVAAARPAGRQ